MPDNDEPQYKDPRKEDIVYGDRRISRVDNSLPDWEMPDTAYRPIPIVWFTGAGLVTLIVLTILAVLLRSQSVWIGVAMGAVAVGGIGAWTWGRGMENAGGGWKLATILMLAGQLAFYAVAIGVLPG